VSSGSRIAWLARIRKASTTKHGLGVRSVAPNEDRRGRVDPPGLLGHNGIVAVDHIDSSTATSRQGAAFPSRCSQSTLHGIESVLAGTSTWNRVMAHHRPSVPGTSIRGRKPGPRPRWLRSGSGPRPRSIAPGQQQSARGPGPGWIGGTGAGARSRPRRLGPAGQRAAPESCTRGVGLARNTRRLILRAEHGRRKSSASSASGSTPPARIAVDSEPSGSRSSTSLLTSPGLWKKSPTTGRTPRVVDPPRDPERVYTVGRLTRILSAC
jgi:hypothetical protein